VITIAYNAITYQGDGAQCTFLVPFDYLQKDFIKVTLNGTPQHYGDDYLVDGREVTFNKAPQGNIELSRETPTDRLVKWHEGSVLTATNMTTQQVQELHIIEEAEYRLSVTSIVLNEEGTKWEGRLKPIGNIGDPEEDTDAVTLKFINDSENGLLGRLKDAFNSYMKSIKDSYDSYMGTLKSTYDDYKTTLKDNFNSYMDGLTAKYNEYTDGITKLLVKVTNSETNAKTSEENAKTSETNAKTSEENAKTLEKVMRQRINNITDGMPVGFEFFQMNPNVPLGALPLLGGTFSKETYSDLWTWVQKQAGYLVDNTRWNELAEAQGGNVPYYADVDENTFRVPSLRCYIKGGDRNGTYRPAGLPNITGMIRVYNEYNYDNMDAQNEKHGAFDGAFDGAFYHEGNAEYPTSNNMTNGTFDGIWNARFDASRSNSTYGKSATVTPETLEGLWCVKAFGTTHVTGDVDLMELVESYRMDAQEIINRMGTPMGLWDIAHTYPVNYVPEDTSNKGWNSLGLCIIYYTNMVLNNQPTQYGQLINIPCNNNNESQQIWIEQNNGHRYYRGGNDSIGVNDRPFRRNAHFTADGHIVFPNGAEIWLA